MDLEEIRHLIENLSWDNPLEVQKDAINKLKLVEDNQITMLVQPSYGKYTCRNAAVVLKNIGYPRVNNVIPQLLEWLKDMNWPGSDIISEILLEIGEPLVPYVKEVLKSNDDMWIYWVIRMLLSKWSKVMLKSVEDELMNILSNMHLGEEVDFEVIKLLINNNIGDIEKIRDEFYKKEPYYSCEDDNMKEIELLIKK